MNRVTPITDELSANPVITPALPPLLDPHTCRICLEQQLSLPQPGMQMLVACECSGSVGHVHHKCLLQWIHKQLNSNRQKRAYCEICKAQIHFHMVKHHYFFCQIQNCLQVSGCNLACLVVEIVLIVVMVVVRVRIGDSNPMLQLLILVVVGILGALLALTTATIIKQVFIRSEKSIERIYSRQECEDRGLEERKNHRSSRVIEVCSMRSVRNTSRRRVLHQHQDISDWSSI